MDTKSGREAGMSQFQSRRKKGHMMNINFTNSDEKAILHFVKDHEELYNKTNN